MTDRIRELASIAGLIKYEVPEWNSDILLPEYDSILAAKGFALLILQDCFKVMNELEDEVGKQFKWKNKEVIPTSGHIQKLKEHFGIK